MSVLPLDTSKSRYEQSLVARDVSPVYRANALRAVRHLVAEVPLTGLRCLRREAVEPWFAALEAGKTARTRNYYRESILLFTNWLQENGKLQPHDLATLPKDDRRLNPVRQRRALTEDEIGKLPAIARVRPLDDARTIRRGNRKGQGVAKLDDDMVKRLEHVGRERALIYRTLILTGLRRDELRTLTVGNLDLTPGAEHLRLDVVNEKSEASSTLVIRTDLADDLRRWVAEQRLTPADRLFTVPTGLLRILDRDMKAAGIPKRDVRGSTVDVHALRTTFNTHLARSGAAPRTAQQAMRHSEIKLTMGVYIDPTLLDMRKALDNLLAFTPTDVASTKSLPPKPPTKAPPTSGKNGQLLALPDNRERPSDAPDPEPKKANNA